LAALQKAIGEKTARFAAGEAEKDFTGHVTIARTHEIKRPQAEILAKLAHSMTDRVFGDWTANRIELMRSELLPGGAQHSVVAAFALKA
jgi:2'-5' RNA ligase